MSEQYQVNEELVQNQQQQHERSNNIKKICLFGLSGDPPTGYGGHVGIVQTLQQLNQFHEIWVIPVYRHTFSEKRQRLVSYEHRFRMCQLAFLPLNDDSTMQTKVVISDAEYMSWRYAVKDIIDTAEQETISVGTAVLLDYLYNNNNVVELHSTQQQQQQNNEYYFCLGADSFFDLIDHKWQQSDRILNELLYNHHTSTTTTNNNSNVPKRRLLVLYRSNTTVEVNDNNNDTTNQQQQSIPNDKYYTKLQKAVEEYSVKLIQMNINNNNSNTKNHPNNVSSTFVRNCSDISILHNNSYIIIPSVLEYIQQHSLYQFCK